VTGRLVGTSTPRVEDKALLRGRARFIDDIRIPNTAAAAFVRSPHAHAAIGGIDVNAARAYPGVIAVHCYSDIAPFLAQDRMVTALPSNSYVQEVHRQILAHEEAVYVGEPVAVVIAENRYIAEDAAAMVVIDYDPLDAVADCRKGAEKGHTVAHRGLPHNIVARFGMGYGDVDAAFKAAPHVFRDQFWLHRGGSHSMEGRGVLVANDEAEDRLTVWSSTQVPHDIRTGLADILGRDESLIRVVTPDIGGGFGPKLVLYQEEVAIAVSAMLLKRPIKWIEDRKEHFISTCHERDQYWNMEIAADGEGRVLGLRGSMLHDHGAYTARGTTVAYGAAQSLTLAYDIPAYKMDVDLILTNKVPVSPVRGAGQPQGIFVMERMLDLIARELQIDRADIRRRNLVPAHRMPFEKQLVTRGGIKVVLDGGDYIQNQEDVLKRADWKGFPQRQEQARRAGRYIGIGVANFVEATGRGPYEPVSVSINASGSIQVATGAVAMGQSTKTMLAQIVADEFGEALENICVTTGDTAGTSLGFGGFNSRQAVMAGSSAHLAAVALRKKVIAVASFMLGTAPSVLSIEAGAVITRDNLPQRSLSLCDIARAAIGRPGFVLPPGITPGLAETSFHISDAMAYGNGSAVAEVEVDVETGGVSVTRIVFSHDCGRPIHPAIVEGQILGGIAHGLGNALYEWMGYDDAAQPVTTNFGEYLLIGAAEMPSIELLHRETPSPLNPLGVKGVGESGVIPIPAAVISAIEDALSPFGVRISQAPIRPPEIIALLRESTARPT